MVQPLGRRRGKHPQHEQARRDPSCSHTGVVDSRTSLLADIVDAAVGDRLAGRSRSAAATRRRAPGPLAGKARHGAAIGALDREIFEPRQRLLARGFLPAPPGRDVRHHQILAQQAPAQARQEAEQRPRLQHAGARHVGDHHAALAQHVDQAGHAELRGRIEFQRIEEIGIDPAQQHVEPLQAGDGADIDAVAADGEVVALDQQEAEIARQVWRARNRSR